MTAKRSRREEDPGDEIRIGISACLLGARVRFDGEHKLDRYLKETLGRFVRFVPVCPEVDIGLGTPREPIRLERHGGSVRLVGVRSGADLTARMARYTARKADELGGSELCGYILKRNSPSCGLERVEVYDRKGSASRRGRGLFAEGLIAKLPFLPVEEEGRLNDPRIRENFFERVFAYRRLRALFRGRWTRGDLVRFHSAEKLLLLAHDPAACQELGRLVARAKDLDRRELAARFQRRFMEALARHASPAKHANVLGHMAGHLERDLDANAKRELQETIAEYRKRLVPLVVPLTLIRHHVRRLGVEHLAGQTYLDPHPTELMLRNHA